MNEQKAPFGIEWTRIRLPDGSRSRGFTWNVMGGCMHACQWQMPDGKIAGCYAKDVAEGLARASYPQGFEHHYYHSERLGEPLKVKEPAGIFLDSMADLMGHWVTEDQIKAVLDTCAKAHWHTFFLLTKNAPRLDKFEFPSNVWVGASSPPDWMFGKRLTRHQQEQMLHRTLKTMQNVKARVRWISFEPLSWDCSEIVAQYPGALTWAVIGAASNGREEFPPAESDLTAMLKILDVQSVPVFYKGNMRSLSITRQDWREEFPDNLFKSRAPKPAYDTPLPDYDMPWAEYVPPAKPTPPKPTRVVNFRDVKEHWNKETQTWDSDEYVYIGRGNLAYNLPASMMWQNPYTMKEDTPEERARVIQEFREAMEQSLKRMPNVLGKKLEELRGKTLVCWCSPKPCHGDVLLELLGEKPAEPQKHKSRELKQLALF